MQLGKMIQGHSATATFTDVDTALAALITGDAPTVQGICSLLAGAAGDLWPIQLGSPKQVQANIFAALYQDDDAHDTCSLTACLNPLHPGPCKGWKGTLFDTAPGAFHALEKAKADKANATRLKKISELKAKGLPIPKKLLTPIEPKAHPHAGQTAKHASGDAHEAGKAVSDAAGVNVQHPGKVTLGEAVKKIGSDATADKGPKGKKPTVASKGIATVIAQEKVTPQYKLDKAATITPEQWTGLSADEKSVIRGELTKIKKDGFGPQQKKATELLDKLSEKAEPSKAETKLTAKHDTKVTAHQAKIQALQEKVDAAKAKVAEHQAKPKLTDTYTPKTVKQAKADGTVAKAGQAVADKAKAEGHKPQVKEATEPNAPKVEKHAPSPKVPDATQAAKDKAAADVAAKATPPVVKEATEAGKKSGKLGDAVTAQEGKVSAAEKKVADAKAKVAAHQAETAKLKAAHEAEAKAAEAAAKAKLSKHVEHAIDMANGNAPGASWSKNHLAAYQALSAEEFHSLSPQVQDKIAAELTKAKTKFLDPKKVVAAQDLLDKFGKGTPSAPKTQTPKIDKVDFAEHMHNHSVTEQQAKVAAMKEPASAHFEVAKKVAGLTAADNPDDKAFVKIATAKAAAGVDSITKPYSPAVLDQPGIFEAEEKLHNALTAQKYAQEVAKAKAQAYNKINEKLALDNGTLSPIEKASLQQYQKHLLNHPVNTDAAQMHKLTTDAAVAGIELDDALQAAKKKADGPEPQDMSPAQLDSHAKELLGDKADPDFSLDFDDLKNADALGKAATKDATSWIPEDAMTDPAVMAKYHALESLHAQDQANQMAQTKLMLALKEGHDKAFKDGVDQHGNLLSQADQDVIYLHKQKLIKKDHAYLTETEDKLADKITDAEDALKEAVAKASKPPEPAKLTDYDKDLIGYAYRDAWGKAANKAALYGVKTSAQSAAVKQHPEYSQLSQDLQDLRVLAGEVALAHAAEHTAQTNTPTHPDTGALLMSSPEGKALAEAMSHTSALESQFATKRQEAQKRLDKIRASAGLTKRTLPKVGDPAVKTGAAESAYHKSGSYSGPNMGKPESAKGYLLAKVGPKLAVKHETPAEKKAKKLGDSTPSTTKTTTAKSEPVKIGDGADISSVPDDVKKTITNDFKSMPDGKYLADPAEKIFDNLVTLAAAHGKGLKDGLSVDQVLKSIDETHSKNLGVANSGMLHAKITDWLATPAGKAYAEAHSVPDKKKVKKLTGEVELPPGVTLEPGQKVQKLAGPGPHDESLKPSAFKAHTSAEAEDEQQAYMKSQGLKWTADQKKAMKAYTGNGPAAYNGINNYLRGKTGYDPVVKQYAVDIQSSMMPLREDTLLKRGTGWSGLPFDSESIFKMVGKTFEDKAFVSTSVAGSGGHFSGKPLQLVIEAPKGTGAVFVNGISHYEGSENEMLLAAGTKFKILSVEKTSNGHVLARVRVVGDK